MSQCTNIARECGMTGFRLGQHVPRSIGMPCASPVEVDGHVCEARLVEGPPAVVRHLLLHRQPDVLTPALGKGRTFSSISVKSSQRI
jgi:hypothetical protein